MSEKNSVGTLTDNQVALINKIIGSAKKTESLMDELKREGGGKYKKRQNNHSL